MAETTEKRALLSFSQLDQYLRCPLKYRFMSSLGAGAG